jgi:hypothetical protein
VLVDWADRAAVASSIATFEFGLLRSSHGETGGGGPGALEWGDPRRAGAKSVAGSALQRLRPVRAFARSVLRPHRPHRRRVRDPCDAWSLTAASSRSHRRTEMVR